MIDRIRKSTVANAIQPALAVLADLREQLERGNHAKALLQAELLAEVLYGIEQNCGSVTPQSLFA